MPHKTLEYVAEIPEKICLARQKDISAIVDLLKLGLKESITPKSVRLWMWKHHENPFGESLVMLAKGAGEIIGVRAFMRWKWQKDGVVFEAVRGVDTVVHPKCQRQGFFRKLTLGLMRVCAEKGYHFLFSTPNHLSRRAYARLGWAEAGNLSVNIRVLRPFSIVLNLLQRKWFNFRTERGEIFADNSIQPYLDHPGLEKLLEANSRLYTGKVITFHSRETLQWRYGNAPVNRYFAAGIENNGLRAVMFYRIKYSSVGIELRITDIFMDSLENEMLLRDLLMKKAREHKADYVTSSSYSAANLVRGGLSLSQRAWGPVVMVHNITMKDTKQIDRFKQWSPSLGDLELF